MSFDSVPDELVLHVAVFLPPPDLVQFSYCCRGLYHCLAGVLANLRQRSKALWVQHDRHPLTLPRLVQDAVSETSDAWLLKRLELWGFRRTWDDWKAFRAFDPAQRHHKFVEEPPEDCTHLSASSAFPESDLDQYRRILLDTLHQPPNESEIMTGFEHGSDGDLRVLLLALSPRISELVVVNHNWITSESVVSPFLAAFSRLRHVPYHAWPIGFQSLRSLKINLEATHPIQPWAHLYREYLVLEDILPALLLPNLRDVHISGLALKNGRLSGPNTSLSEIPNSSLPITSLVLRDQSNPWECSHYFALINKPKALKVFDVGPMLERVDLVPRRHDYRYSENRRMLLGFLASRHGKTLEHVKVGDKGRLEVDLLARLEKLKHAVFDLDVARKCCGQPRRSWDHLEWLLPPSLEFLTITHLDVRDPTMPQAVATLQQLARTRGSRTGGTTAKLRDICINFQPPELYHNWDSGFMQPLFMFPMPRHRYFTQKQEMDMDNDLRHFRRKWAAAAADCEAHGVRLHTTFSGIKCQFHSYHIHDRDVQDPGQLHTMPKWRDRISFNERVSHDFE